MRNSTELIGTVFILKLFAKYTLQIMQSILY